MLSDAFTAVSIVFVGGLRYWCGNVLRGVRILQTKQMEVKGQLVTVFAFLISDETPARPLV